jgi:hypothetical protein
VYWSCMFDLTEVDKGRSSSGLEMTTIPGHRHSREREREKVDKRMSEKKKNRNRGDRRKRVDVKDHDELGGRPVNQRGGWEAGITAGGSLGRYDLSREAEDLNATKSGGRVWGGSRSVRRSDRLST